MSTATKMTIEDALATQAFIDDMTQEWQGVYEANYGKHENYSPEWRAAVDELTNISKFVIEAEYALGDGLLPW